MLLSMAKERLPHWRKAMILVNWLSSMMLQGKCISRCRFFILLLCILVHDVRKIYCSTQCLPFTYCIYAPFASFTISTYVIITPYSLHVSRHLSYYMHVVLNMLWHHRVATTYKRMINVIHSYDFIFYHLLAQNTHGCLRSSHIVALVAFIYRNFLAKYKLCKMFNL